MFKKSKGIWYLLPLSVREKVEAPYRYEVKKEIEIIFNNIGDKKIYILDAGAGDCFAKKLFVGHKYLAMDIKENEIITAKKELDVVGDIQNMPFQRETFDMILCLEVLEHVVNPQAALKECFRVLKRDGILLMSVPLMAVGFHDDFYRFSSSALKIILEKAGFKIKKMNPTGGYFRMLGWQISKLSYMVRKPQNKIFWPFYYMVKIPVGLVFQIVIPLCLFYLDWFDKKKNETCGYMVVANK